MKDQSIASATNITLKQQTLGIFTQPSAPTTHVSPNNIFLNAGLHTATGIG